MNIFITGGTTGIGRALTKFYLKQGHHVGVSSRNQNHYDEMVKELSNDLDFSNDIFSKQLRFFSADVSNFESHKKAFDQFLEWIGQCDMLIANAGISAGTKLAIPDFKVVRNIVETNAIGVLNSVEIATKHMLEKKSGHLVAISSPAGMIGLPKAMAYSSSKSFVTTMFESLAIDYPKNGIDITCISPGFIDTPLTQKNSHAMPFLMDSDRAAKYIAKAIQEKKAHYMFPWQMYLVTTILKLLPRKLYRWIMKLNLYVFLFFFLMTSCKQENLESQKSQNVKKVENSLKSSENSSKEDKEAPCDEEGNLKKKREEKLKIEKAQNVVKTKEEKLEEEFGALQGDTGCELDQ